jgi:hypothetical protein
LIAFGASNVPIHGRILSPSKRGAG